MTAKSKALKGEVIVPDEAPVPAVNTKRTLASIAKKVKAEFGKGLDAQFAIGHLLIEARSLMPGDTEFGQWFAEQEFAFSQPTAHRLRAAAEREDEVREFIAQSGRNGRDIGVTSAVKELTAKTPEQKKRDAHPGYADPDAAPEGESVHAGYDALRTAYRLLTGEAGFDTMHVDDLAESAGWLKELVEAYQSAKAGRVSAAV